MVRVKETKGMFVVFDLDGTLCNIEHRVHHIRGGEKKDWPAFFAACVDDAPCQPIIAAFHAHVDAGHYVEIWSGRSNEVEQQTMDWLWRVGIAPHHLTRMRPAGDHQPDVKLKRAWLRSLPEDKRPALIYDDRKSVVDMWREEGIACCQVAPGEF